MSRRQTISPALRREVIARWGDECWLGLPGCTGHGEEDDHIVPWSHGGRDTVNNIRRACKHCNSSRSDRIISGYPATIHAVIGPPGAGKTTYARNHAEPGAIILDMDQMAAALAPDMDTRCMPPELVRAAQGAWLGAYRAATRIETPGDVWIIRCVPRLPHHPRLLDEWIALGYDVHVIDPGAHVTMARLSDDERAGSGIIKSARRWYALRITAQAVRHRMERRHTQLAALGLAPDPDGVPTRPVW